MTKAQILTAVRNLVNEQSTDAGALLDDTNNLLGFIDDAIEQVILDLVTVPGLRDYFLTSEDITLVAGTAAYTLTGEYWQIIKVEKTIASENETEIEILDPLKFQYFRTHDETADEPNGCYIVNNVLTFVPTPAKATTAYARVWGVRPEATTLPDAGPTYIPRAAHRLIVFWAASLACVMIGADPRPLQAYYVDRLAKIKRIIGQRYQQKPRFLRESVNERNTVDARDKAFYDPDWP